MLSNLIRNLMTGAIREGFVVILFLIVFVIAVLVRSRISLKSTARVAIGSTVGFIISIAGFLLLDQVIDPAAVIGARVIGWVLGLILFGSFLAIPFAVSGYISSRLVKAK